MKKKMCLLICLALIPALTIGGTCACTGKNVRQYKSSGVSEVLEQGMADADGKNAESEALDSTEPPITTEPVTELETTSLAVDVDLTALSSTMVYAEVYHMMSSPEDYIGKTVKMDGMFAVYHDQTTGNYYYACVIQDATACCAQGIEFVLTDDYRYPDDYPKANDEICVIGTFDTYQEGDYTYCTLRNAKLI